MANVFIYDEFNPEATAMLQALYSRSSLSVVEHVEKVRRLGSSKFMESFYVGYGHASIGDCGVTTIFLEDISILAAKAIEDSPLFSGQETSTRYIDFSKQRLYDPVQSDLSSQILEEWIRFYLEAMEPTRQYLASRFPLRSVDDQSVWKKAINARAFDILRGFLPAAATTQVAWTTSLRHAHDKLAELSAHPLEEVREIGAICRSKLGGRYPSSFSHKRRDELDQYLHRIGRRLAYQDEAPNVEKERLSISTTVQNSDLEILYPDEVSSRPKGAMLPRYVGVLGTFRCRFLLDYGSFRDIQRHRNGLCRIPLLTTEYGFNKWYLDQLPPELGIRAAALIESQISRIKNLREGEGVTAEKIQYFVALGFDVSCELTYDLRELVYVTELRSSKTVHPTLRAIAIGMHEFLSEVYPRLVLHTDLEEDDWDVRRGKQDIVERFR